MMVRYKESNEFVNDAVEVGVDAYIVKFTDYEKKVIEAFWHST